MVVFQVLYAHQAFLLVFFELLLPLSVKFLQLFVADVDVLTQLVLLNIRSQFILILVDVCLEEAYLAHQVFVEGVLLHIAQLFGQDLHLLFDEREDEDLLVFIELPVTSLVENIKELIRRCQS